MLRKTLARFLLLVPLTLLACRTTAPSVPDLPRGAAAATVDRSEKAQVEMSLGTITVSTPKFTAIRSGPTDANKLNFGDFKSIENLFEMVRQANVGISQSVYRSAGLQLALSLAGMQLYQNDTITLGGNLSGSFDVLKLVEQVQAGSIDPNDLPVDLSGDLGISRSLTSSSTFESPEVPDRPDLPTTPDSVLEKLVELLTGSDSEFTLDPFNEIRLVAALHNDMVNTEAFYNFDGVFEGARYRDGVATGTDGVWAPYRAQFLVTVRPGWYTFLNQFDATVEINFEKDSDSDRDIRLIAVVPQESAQIIDEVSSSLEQYALAASATGSFKSAAVSGAYNSLAAAARRLEGFKKNTTHLVTYPSDHSTKVTVRPTVVPEQRTTELQPTSKLFTAYVMVKQDQEADADRTIQQDEADDIGQKSAVGFLSDGETSHEASEIQQIEREIANVRDDFKVDVSTLQQEINTLKSHRLAESAQPGDNGGSQSGDDDGDGDDDKKKGLYHGLYFPTELPVHYRAAFEPTVYLKERRKGFTGAVRTFYHAPKKVDRAQRYYVTYKFDQETPCVRGCCKPEAKRKPACAWRSLSALVPPYQSKVSKPFGFSETPIGFYDAEPCDEGCGQYRLTGYVGYAISNPPISPDEQPPAVWYSSERDGTWHEFPQQPNHAALAGVIKVALGKIDDDTDLKKHKTRFLLMIRRKNIRHEYDTAVQEVILPHRSAISSGGVGGGATITIDRDGISAAKVPVGDISPALAAILTNGHVTLNVTEKAGQSGGGAAGPNVTTVVGDNNRVSGETEEEEESNEDSEESDSASDSKPSDSPEGSDEPDTEDAPQEATEEEGSENHPEGSGSK